MVFTRVSHRHGLAVLALVALALAPAAQAGIKNRIEIGSILIEIVQGNPAALAGMAASANQGLEKTISYAIPRLSAADTRVSVPLFLLAADVDDNNKAVARGIDTLLFLTNNTPPGGETVVVHVTFRSGGGVALNDPVVQGIAPGQTAVISAISTLNP